ncbi:hypothetical protein [uncultured Ruminococcus sp.]|nr:hypothetical protein [uncultured Ruminococcus sp.]
MDMIVCGVIILCGGIAVLMISQFLLHRWIKKFNSQWKGDSNEMS